MSIPCFYETSKELLQPGEAAELSRYIGRTIWVKEMTGMAKPSFTFRLFKRIINKPLLPYKGDVIQTFSLYTKSQRTGEENWNYGKRHFLMGWGEDIEGNLWFISPQSDLPGHWAQLSNSRWIFLASF